MLIICNNNNNNKKNHLNLANMSENIHDSASEDEFPDISYTAESPESADRREEMNKSIDVSPQVTHSVYIPGLTRSSGSVLQPI